MNGMNEINEKCFNKSHRGLSCFLQILSNSQSLFMTDPKGQYTPTVDFLNEWATCVFVSEKNAHDMELGDSHHSLTPQEIPLNFALMTEQTALSRDTLHFSLIAAIYEMDVCYDCRPVAMVTLRAAQVYLYVRKGHEYHIKHNYACVRKIALLMSNVRPSGAALLCVWKFPTQLPTLKLEDEVFISKVFLWSVSSPQRQASWELALPSKCFCSAFAHFLHQSHPSPTNALVSPSQWTSL